MSQQSAVGTLWCDGFDADLLAVVPGAAGALGDTADVALWTHSNPTNGKINCPSSWHTDDGLAAFFSTRDRSPAPAHYWTRDRLVECTFVEAVRDEWVHGSLIVVNRWPVWQPPSHLMQHLMYDLRGWTVLLDLERERMQEQVRAELRAAAHQLREVLVT